MMHSRQKDIFLFLIFILLLLTLSFSRKDLEPRPGTDTAYTRSASTAAASTNGVRYLTITPLDGSEGRLGNFCFRYAAALGIAAKNNMTLVLPATGFVHSMREIFNVKAPLVTEINLEGVEFTEIYEAHWGIFDSSKFHLEPRHVALSFVYSQSWRYFTHVNDQAIRELSINKHLAGRAAFLIRQKKKEFGVTIVVGLHVRRGDFLDKVNADWGYAVATPQYFTRATSWFVNKYGEDILFLVASDDVAWAKENIDFSGAKHEFSTSNAPHEDFITMIGCDHHIISVGSFGWWTAFLSGGDVVYYLDFPTPLSRHSENHKHYDYYPSQWIGLR